MSVPTLSNETRPERLTEPPEAFPYKCEAAGIYCGALSIEQLAAAGRGRVCCRHYWEPAVSGDGSNRHGGSE